MRLKVTVADQPLHRFGVGHQGARLALIPQAVGVPDAVRAVQRAALNVVQAQPALAVLDHLAGTPPAGAHLFAVQQRDECTHLGLPVARYARALHWESRTEGHRMTRKFLSSF